MAVTRQGFAGKLMRSAVKRTGRPEASAACACAMTVVDQACRSRPPVVSKTK